MASFARMAPPVRMARSALPVLCLVLALLVPASACADCRQDGEMILYIPVPRKGAFEALYAPVTSWSPPSGAKVRTVNAPGRGGGYALARLTEPGGPDCAMAALQYPSFLLQSEVKNSPFTESGIRVSAFFARSANTLWVAENYPGNSLREFILIEQERAAHSGVPPALAGTGSFSDQHMATLIFARSAGLVCRYMPLIELEACREAVLLGQAVAFWTYALPRSALPGFRPLAVAAPERMPDLPETPTFTEAGVPCVSQAYFGVGFPAATPRPGAARDLADFLASAAVREQVRGAGFVPFAPDPSSLEDFRQEQQQLVHNVIQEYSIIPLNLRRR